MTTVIANQGTILKSHMLMLLPEPTYNRTPMKYNGRVLGQNQVTVVLPPRYNWNWTSSFGEPINYQRLNYTSTVSTVLYLQISSSLLSKSLCVVNC